MKSTIVILLVIVLEALGYSYLLGEENEKLQAENAVMKQKILDQKSKINELNWIITKMDLVIAGKAIDEIFQKSEKMTPDDATADKIKEDGNNEENVIYID